MRRSVAHLPLHGGQAPPWLFRRMKKLAGAIVRMIVIEYGPGEMLSRLADPMWFQAFGCVLGFDWHSSGLTTVTCGAMKEAYRMMDEDLGIFVAGGKGGVSRKTPGEIEQVGEKHAIDPQHLVYASKMSAKVDSAAVQDGYQLYHHCFFFDNTGRWCVVQQGMNEQTRFARRYHWLGDRLDSFVNEPHSGIIAEAKGEALNMVASESDRCRQACAEISRIEPAKILREVTCGGELFLPKRHPVTETDLNVPHLQRIMRSIYQTQPASFEQLLGLGGVGPKTIRSLALIAELVYDAPASRRDPATFSFAHGGKDGHPFPVDRRLYDRNIAVLEQCVLRARINGNEKDHALRRLQGWLQVQEQTSSSG